MRSAFLARKETLVHLAWRFRVSLWVCIRCPLGRPSSNATGWTVRTTPASQSGLHGCVQFLIRKGVLAVLWVFGDVFMKLRIPTIVTILVRSIYSC